MVLDAVLNVVFIAYNVNWASINGYTLLPLLSKDKSKPSEEKLDDDNALPSITLMLPAYKEENIVARTIKRIEEMDYPKSKLELMLITESDDGATYSVCKKYGESYLNIRNVRVGDNGQPRGKPRALNQALEEATGDIVGVLDAEDVPERDLLRKVAYAIKVKGYDVAQGILSLKTNGAPTWRDKQFAAEYYSWYRVMMPAAANAGLPLPLGGTTNFIRTDVIRKLKWDANNLTEDFDLGMRLYNGGYKTGLINAVTTEETPRDWRSWIRQRTRWERGKLQTLKKLLSTKAKTKKQHLVNYMSGMAAHLGAINISGIALGGILDVYKVPMLPWLSDITYINLASLTVYQYIQGRSYWKSAPGDKHRLLNSLYIGITLPAYWFMQWISNLRALKQQYIDKKIVWEKTEHFGLD